MRGREPLERAEGRRSGGGGGGGAEEEEKEEEEVRRLVQIVLEVLVVALEVLEA